MPFQLVFRQMRHKFCCKMGFFPVSLFSLAVIVILLAHHNVFAQLGSVGGRISITNPKVALSYCTVSGEEYTLATGTPQRYKILAFTGIPYATPPVGIDRFRVSNFKLNIIKKFIVKTVNQTAAEANLGHS